MQPRFLPYGCQTIEDDDIAAVAEAMRADLLTTGPLVGRFEQAFAAQVGATHAVCCNSGTAGLHLAVMALGLEEGEIVIVPAITFVATANVARYMGAEVVFADVDPLSGLMTVESLRAALDRAASKPGQVRAVMPVHLKGVPVDSPGIADLASRSGIAVIEDACHALGTTYGNGAFRVGANCHAAMTVFSTHPVKTITTGEGGVVTTEDDKLATRLRRFRTHGIEANPAHWTVPAWGMEAGEPAPWYYELATLGFNYRLPDVNCALGLSQLGKLQRFLTRRAELVDLYDKLLAPLHPLLRTPERPADCSPGWHLYAVQIDFAAAGLSRSVLMRRLRAAGIGTQVHYVPVHGQPYYRSRQGFTDLPGAESYYRGTLSLPLFPKMANSDVERVADVLTQELTGGLSRAAVAGR